MTPEELEKLTTKFELDYLNLQLENEQIKTGRIQAQLEYLIKQLEERLNRNGSVYSRNKK